MRERGQLLAHAIHVGGQGRVVVEPVLGDDLRIRLPPHGDLVGLADERNLPAPGGWVDGAGQAGQRRHHEHPSRE